MAQRRAADEPWAGGTADGELVGRTLAGDRDAFAALFDRYARQVYTIAYRISGNPSDAEDLTQETFLRALRTLHTLRDRQAVGGWLSRVATHACIDALRRKGKLAQAELSDAAVEAYPDASRSPQDAILLREDQRAVWAALERLSGSQRTALTLREMQGLPYAAIAQEMGLSLASVEVLIFRARRRFREHYERLVAGGLPDIKPLRCKEARKALASAIDREGSAEERRTVLAHVRACPACRAEITAQRGAARRRAALPLLPLPPALAQPFAPPVAPTLPIAPAQTLPPVAPPMAPPPSVPMQPAVPMPAGPALAPPAPPPMSPLPIPLPPPAATIGAGTAAATGTALGAKVAVLGGAKAALLAAGAAVGIAASAAPALHAPVHATHTVAYSQAPTRQAPVALALAPAQPINRVPARPRVGASAVASLAGGVTIEVKVRVRPVPSTAMHRPAPRVRIVSQVRPVSRVQPRLAGHGTAHSAHHRTLPRAIHLAPARPAPAPPAVYAAAVVHAGHHPPRFSPEARIVPRSPTVARSALAGKRLRPRARVRGHTRVRHNLAHVQPGARPHLRTAPGRAHPHSIARRQVRVARPGMVARGQGHKSQRPDHVASRRVASRRPAHPRQQAAHKVARRVARPRQQPTWRPVRAPRRPAHTARRPAASPHDGLAPVRHPRQTRHARVQKPRATPRKHGAPHTYTSAHHGGHASPAHHGGPHVPARHGGPRHGRGHH